MANKEELLALDWVTENPDDPRSEEILGKLGLGTEYVGAYAWAKNNTPDKRSGEILNKIDFEIDRDKAPLGEVDFKTRFAVKNLLDTDPDAGKKYLERKGFKNVVSLGGADFTVTDPKTGQRLELDRKSWIPTIEDFTDIMGDVAKGTVSSVGRIGQAIGAALSPATGGASFALGTGISAGISGTLEAGQQLIARATGVREEFSPSVLAKETALGAVIPGGAQVARGIGRLAKGASGGLLSIAMGAGNKLTGVIPEKAISAARKFPEKIVSASKDAAEFAKRAAEGFEETFDKFNKNKIAELDEIILENGNPIISTKKIKDVFNNAIKELRAGHELPQDDAINALKNSLGQVEKELSPELKQVISPILGPKGEAISRDVLQEAERVQVPFIQGLPDEMSASRLLRLKRDIGKIAFGPETSSDTKIKVSNILKKVRAAIDSQLDLIDKRIEPLNNEWSEAIRLKGLVAPKPHKEIGGIMKIGKTKISDANVQANQLDSIIGSSLGTDSEIAAAAKFISEKGSLVKQIVRVAAAEKRIENGVANAIISSVDKNPAVFRALVQSLGKNEKTRGQLQAIINLIAERGDQN